MVSRYDKFVAYLIILQRAFSQGSACPPGWKNWNQSCYAIYFNRVSWMDASEFCESRGSHLVMPNSQPENDFIWRMMTERLKSLSGAGVWIGCKRKSADSSFVCAGNEGMSYTNWAPGNPKNKETPVCALYGVDGEGKWKSVGCTPRIGRNVVCEMPTAPRMYCMTADENGRLVNDLP
ncbi:snaclec coagulation factor IX-binding protein subunit A-like [Patiria miniata]|uniref:C-type lectin domain-containing protein n=1 Tax=Patiria miniata TaxID=46514 RepID=A0A913Z709_PATMI|nr:snaclec coagulation factor IX-binding protein subunit A-like [Patiria miniata]